MIATKQFTLDLADAEDIKIVGGKAANLRRLIGAGFPVPNGFVISTHAFRAVSQSHANLQGANAHHNGAAAHEFLTHTIPENVGEEIRAAYRALGGGPVAVRSSATAEDLADASMAGQYETFLDVEGEAALLEAVSKCWSSFDSPRIRAYFRNHGIDPANEAMAIVVQQLVPARVAGVLFTTNPQPGRSREMLVEASWGLGEAVVSGRVQPDIFRICHETGKVLAAKIAEKHLQFSGGRMEGVAVEAALRRQASLDETDLQKLWQIGRQISEHFHAPQDIEWAIHENDINVLQSRPITTLADAQAYDDLLRGTQQHLRDQQSPARGPWVLHNLAETLTHPTPLSWSVVRQFMSGGGAMGTAYRTIGFEPSADVTRNGFLELIAGRVYMDVARAPEMFFQDFPFAYDADDLKFRPGAGQSPPTLPRGSLQQRMRAARRSSKANVKLQDLSFEFDQQLKSVHFPTMERYVAAAQNIDLAKLTNDKLIEAWREHRRFVLDEFGTQSILASLIAGQALEELHAFLQDNFWQHDSLAVAHQLSVGGNPNRTLLADAELFEIATGKRDYDEWLTSHGHRAPNEFDLAAPRWREQPENVAKLAATLARGEHPLARHSRSCEASNLLTDDLQRALPPKLREELLARIEKVRRFICFREDAKDVLMLGYELLRNLAVEVGRRLNLDDDVFFLEEHELLSALRTRVVPQLAVQHRKGVYRAEKQVSLPNFIDSNGIHELGSPHEVRLPTGGLAALSLSHGIATGPARILHSPIEADNLAPGYILVCPSTDPSWTPLFASAAGLILECGGLLSHGAVVAREMGLPAVVLTNATQLFADGELVQLDANRGWAARAGGIGKITENASSDPNDTRIAPDLVPPRPGRKDRAAARARNICALLWSIFLVGFFLLPETWIRQPTLAAIDCVLWPVVRVAGKPATVAIVAAVLAVTTLLVQKFATDNRRLREAKRRAAALQIQAKSLPAKSPRRRAIARLVASVQQFSLFASLVPIGILLGPMSLPFVWFSERVDPTVADAPPGSAVHVVAKVDSDWPHPVQLGVPDTITLDDTTPASRTLQPIRKTLERTLELLRQPPSNSKEPWELQSISATARQQAAGDLQSYLQAGIPPQGVTWVLRPPADFQGKFPVTLESDSTSPIIGEIVLGDDNPPAPTIVQGTVNSPLKELRIFYPKPKVAAAFWQPFRKLHDSDSPAAETGTITARLSSLDIGWLWLYLLVYLPVLYLARAILHVG